MDLKIKTKRAVIKNLNILEKGLSFDDQKLEYQITILLSLSNLKTPQVLPIKEKIVKLLKLKQNDIFSTRDPKIVFPLLIAFFEYDPKLITGKILAQAVALLIQLEIKTGGPYKGDLLTNIQIAYFLSLQEIDLEELTKWIESQLSKKSLTSEEIYVLSRFYKGAKKVYLMNYLLKDSSLSPLSISALLNFGVLNEQVKAEISYLLKGRHDCLTMAVCLEIFQNFLDQTSKQPFIKKDIPKDKIAEEIYQQVMDLVEQRLLLLEPDLKKDTKIFLQQIIQNDKNHQIILLPYIFTKTLGKNTKGISPALLIKLGMANLYGWLAYTIYDDFLDEEGSPQNLPVANIALRELITIFNNILPKLKFQPFFNQVMDELEGANAWEVNNCRVKISDGKVLIDKKRLPKYGNFQKLASRSLGHALGPLAILFVLGFTKESPEVKSLAQFFRHYLIARQLNDDAHDWEKDLQKGHLNSVAVEIFSKYQGLKESFKIDTSLEGLAFLQQFLQQEVMIEISRKVFQHIKLARKNLRQITILKSPEFLESLLIPVEQAAQNTIQAQEEAQQFLRSYQELS